MICKNCGTQCTGKYCSYCGHPLYAEPEQQAPAAEPTATPAVTQENEQPTPSAPQEAPVQEAPVQEEPVQAAPVQDTPVQEAPTQKEPAPASEKPAQPAEPAEKPASQKKPNKKRVRKLRRAELKEVWWQAILMFLPLAYLFFELLAVFDANHLALNSAGQSHLSLLFEKLISPSFVDNSVAQLTEATLGSGKVLFTEASFLTQVMGEGSAVLWIPFGIVALLAVFSAFMGFTLLLSGGKILNSRHGVDLCLVSGFGAAFSPLIGLLALRVVFCVLAGPTAADSAMQCFLPTLECMMLFLVCMVALLPALRSLRQVGAETKQARFFVSYPFRFAEKRKPKTLKVLIVITSLLAVAAVAAFVLLPITSAGSLLTACSDIDGLIAALGTLFAGGITDTTALVAPLCQVFAVLPVLCIFLGVVLLVIDLIRIGRANEKKLREKKYTRGRVAAIGKILRDMLLAPYVCYIILQIILAVIYLFTTPMALRIGFADIDNTLHTVYLTLAQARGMCGTTTLYAFLALGGSLLWNAAHHFAQALLLKVRGIED